MPLIPAFGRQKQVDLCEFKASLIYTMNSRTARATEQEVHMNYMQEDTYTGNTHELHAGGYPDRKCT